MPLATTSFVFCTSFFHPIDIFDRLMWPGSALQCPPSVPWLFSTTFQLFLPVLMIFLATLASPS